MRIGYFLSSEEWGPRDLVQLAIKAQRAGFEDLPISDHYHPWNDEQGHSPFVWSVIGAIAQATDHKVTSAEKPPPILVSGFGPKAIEVAARIGDGFLTVGPDAEAMPCGPDVERHVQAIEEYADARFDEVYVQQIGPEQDLSFEAYREHVIPRFK